MKKNRNLMQYSGSFSAPIGAFNLQLYKLQPSWPQVTPTGILLALRASGHSYGDPFGPPGLRSPLRGLSKTWNHLNPNTHRGGGSDVVFQFSTFNYSKST